MPRPLPAPVLLLLALAAPATAADNPVDPARAAEDGALPSPTAIPWDGAVGLQPDGDAAIATGPNWKAVLTEGRFELTPALGAQAPFNRTLGWELEGILRGDEVVWSPSGSPSPTIDGLRATFDRAGGVVERYDVLPEGIEQSFVLPERLGSGGDLVVRGRLGGNLSPRRLGTGLDGLRFEDGERAAVAVGAVFAIDAGGERAEGWLRTDGVYLDLVVPAHFVDRATWPLVVDPIFGPDLEVATAGVNFDPEAAFDTTNDLWLIAWTTQFSALDLDIRARKLRANGTFASGIFSLESDPSVLAVDPSVGNVNALDRFLVAWSEAAAFGAPTRIAGVSLAANAIFFSGSKAVLSNEPSFCRDLSVASEPLPPYQRLLMVYESAGVGIIIQEVDLSGSVPLALTKNFVSANPDDVDPVISPTGGPDGKYMIVWERETTASPFTGSPSNLHARVFNRIAVPISIEVQINSTAFTDEFDPDVDGDGQEFLVVYDTRDNLTGADGSVIGRRLSLDGISIAVGDEVGINGTSVDKPSVAWTGYDFIESTVRANGPADPDGSLQIGWNDRISLEPIYGFGTNKPTDMGTYPASLSSAYQGDLSPRHSAVAVYAEQGSGGSEQIRAYLLEGGFYAEALGLGCGLGGQATAGAPILGASMVHRLTGAPPNSIGLFTLGFSRLDFPCGPCVFVPNTMAPGFIAGALVQGDGEVDHVTPIPDSAVLAGLDFWTQWAVYVTQPECGLLGLDVSTALEHEVYAY